MSDYDWGSDCCADAAMLAMLTAPTQSPAVPEVGEGTGTAGLTYHVDLGTAWLTRDDQQVRVDRADIPALVAWLLVAEDRLADAA